MASVFLKQPLPRGEDLPYDDGIPLESHWHRSVLRFFDPQGKPLPTPAEAEAQRADAEMQRADAEMQRADAETKARHAAEAKIARSKALLAQKQ